MMRAITPISMEHQWRNPACAAIEKSLPMGVAMAQPPLHLPALAQQWRTRQRQRRLGAPRLGAPLSRTSLCALPVQNRIAHRCGMNSIETIESRPVPGKTKAVSRRVRHAIDLMISGQCKTQKAAAQQAGLTRERLCRALKESHVQKYMGEQTRVLLANAQTTAAATLMRLMDEAKSEHVRKDVATTILGINGITAGGNHGPVVSIGLQVGYVIDLSPRPTETSSSAGPAASKGYEP